MANIVGLSNPIYPYMSPLRIQVLAIAAFIGLILLTLAWEGWLAPARNLPPGLWLTVKSLPLLLPLFGLLNGKRYTYKWASMLILLYLGEGIVLAVSQWQQSLVLHSVLPWALLEIVLTLSFFVSAIAYVRASR